MARKTAHAIANEQNTLKTGIQGKNKGRMGEPYKGTENIWLIAEMIIITHIITYRFFGRYYWDTNCRCRTRVTVSFLMRKKY